MALSSFKPAPPGAENNTRCGVVGDGLTISKAMEEMGDGTETLTGPAQAVATQRGEAVGEAGIDAVPLLGNGVCPGGEAPATKTPKVSTLAHNVFLSGDVDLRDSLDLMEVEIPACNGVVPEEACIGKGNVDEVEVPGSLQSSDEVVQQEGMHSKKRKQNFVLSGVSSAVSSNGALDNMVRGE